MTSEIARLEALLYVAGDDGLTIENLSNLLQLTSLQVKKRLRQLQKRYIADPDCGLHLLHVDHLYKITNSPETSKTVQAYFAKDFNQNLSQSALEILAIVAYRQPITRVEIDQIRGVNSAGAIQTLVWRGLIKSAGKKDAPGHPNLYVTTTYFLQYFHYRSLADLPLIENFTDEEESKGSLFTADSGNDDQKKNK